MANNILVCEQELRDWAETHYEVSTYLNEHFDSIDELTNTGDRWGYAFDITTAFHQKYKDTVWGEDADYFDELELFISHYLYNIW